jgi:hypothetical protein
LWRFLLQLDALGSVHSRSAEIRDDATLRVASPDLPADHLSLHPRSHASNTRPEDFPGPEGFGHCHLSVDYSAPCERRIMEMWTG